MRSFPTKEAGLMMWKRVSFVERLYCRPLRLFAGGGGLGGRSKATLSIQTKSVTSVLKKKVWTQQCYRVGSCNANNGAGLRPPAFFLHIEHCKINKCIEFCCIANFFAASCKIKSGRSCQYWTRHFRMFVLYFMLRSQSYIVLICPCSI